MPRPPRIDIPGLIYHITNRGVKKLFVFHSDEDRQNFLRFLMQAKQIFPFRLHAYSLMTNHYHLLLQTLDHSLSKTLHYFQSLYAHYFNRRNAAVGHVFQSRFHSIPVQEDTYFTVVARYIDLNAVRAGIVLKPEDYPWCDFGRLMRGEADPLTDRRLLLGYFGDDPATQRERYRQFVYDDLQKPPPVDDRLLQKMRFWGMPPRLRRVSLAQIPH